MWHDDEMQGDANISVSLENRKFSDIVGSVSSVYPEEKAKDISVSFYFICLLHLANERNLKICGSQDLSDFTISQ